MTVFIMRMLFFPLFFASMFSLGGCSLIALPFALSIEEAKREEASKLRQNYRDEIISAFRLEEALPNQCPAISPQPWLSQADAARLPLQKLRAHAEKGDPVAQTEAARRLYAALMYFGDRTYYSDEKLSPSSRFQEVSDEDLKRIGALGSHYARCASVNYPLASGLYGIYQWSVNGDQAGGEASLRKGCSAGSLEAMLFLRARIAKIPITSGRELAALDARLNVLPDTKLSPLFTRWWVGVALPQPQPWPEFEDAVAPLSQMRSPAAQKALFTEFAQIWGDLPPCKRLPEVIYHDVDEDPGINLARIRENKELADRGDTAMQHSMGAKLDICVSRFPNLAPRLDKAIRHYYGCVEWPITRAQLARYLERQGDCVAMENILRLAVVEDNLRQKGSDTSYFTINQLLCEYLRPLNIFDAAAQPLVRRVRAARSMDELSAALPPLELYYDTAQKSCLGKSRYINSKSGYAPLNPDSANSEGN